jgi:ATP-dependent HslUV protease ATP-binding subunit HslU
MNPPPVEYTPQEIVRELDRYIIGQAKAKRSVAVALRERWRRRQVAADLQNEITPKNIIMIGATGIGKTEIARRLAKLARAPFLKVEATKFTEVGYVGKDVESMIRDLVELAVTLVRDEEREGVATAVDVAVEEKLLDLLYPRRPGEENEDRTREKLRGLLKTGALEDKQVEVNVTERPAMQSFEVLGQQGMEELGQNLKEILGNMMPKHSKAKKMTVAEARAILREEEASRRLDPEQLKRKAVLRTEQSGIVFLDEIDKVASRGMTHGPDVSREGVQRDLLPIVEGTTVSTKYGPVKTDHILFIAAGAFHVSKPSDLIPELQGRFPIRVELDALSEDDLYRILKEPETSLPKQARALLATDQVDVRFEDRALKKLAELAAKINAETENIGARRLHTVLEKLLEDIAFRAPEQGGSFVIDEKFVLEKLGSLIENRDLTRYIL